MPVEGKGKRKSSKRTQKMNIEEILIGKIYIFIYHKKAKLKKSNQHMKNEE